jgi:hypothetical protein
MKCYLETLREVRQLGTPMHRWEDSDLILEEQGVGRPGNLYKCG